MVVVGAVEGTLMKLAGSLFAYDIILKQGGTGRFMQIDKALNFDRMILKEVEVYCYDIIQ